MAMHQTAEKRLIRSGTVIDGTGTDRRLADVLIEGDRITAVGEPGTLGHEDAEITEAAGLVVSPGFIDVHTHDDNAVLVGPDMTPKISQGHRVLNPRLNNPPVLKYPAHKLTKIRQSSGKIAAGHAPANLFFAPAQNGVIAPLEVDSETLRYWTGHYITGVQ